MNFLMRSTTHVASEPPSVNESLADTSYTSKSGPTLEGLIAEDPYPQYSTVEDCEGETDGTGGENGSRAGINSKNDSSVVAKHLDVSEEEGWITIPYKGLPENWNHAPDIHSFRTLDRSFVFPGEQVHILACLSACKKDTEIVTPFKVAAVMNKNGIGKSPNKENGDTQRAKNLLSRNVELSPHGKYQKGENPSTVKIDPQKDIYTGESLLRMEDHKRQTEILLQKFEDSHFFVRIADSGEPLWSKRSALQKFSDSSETDSKKSSAIGSQQTAKDMSPISAVIDRGNFDVNVSGGVARNSVKCCALPNGDIVVLLQVNVGVDFLRDPYMEILQFERFQEKIVSSENQENSIYTNQDPCRELLKWLLPLDNTLPPPARSLSPPRVNPNSGMGSTSQRSNISASSGSQLFSFGHFRSYSMSSLPQNTTQPSAPVKAASSKPSFDLEDWDQISLQKLPMKKTGIEELLSFRGVALERQRFSVRCGLEGIYIPGRRWRRKLEIIQPVEIRSFPADCNADDLLCVQIKNVAPAHTPDIVIFIDAITIVFAEASKSGPPSSLPIACIEAGNDHCLPDMALRRGEEHSFILKPATSTWNTLKVHGERSSPSSNVQVRNAASSLGRPPKNVEGRKAASIMDQYAIMVSCRCNYTESRLFFKQPTSWRPRVSRDIMISVASEMSGQSPGPNERNSQLPVQVLTLQASNLTSENLTLTVLAPASFSSPPSIVSLSSPPPTPMSPFVGFSEIAGRVTGKNHGSSIQSLSSASLVSESQKQNGDGGARSMSINEQASPASDVIPSSGLGCTHLWLQSRVPLGCIPSQSTATIKLELLPLTDGIITLDTLQIDVKEKGLTYIPKCSLKINATSSISTGIV
ncbi:Heat-inducible transcription repressor [Quillaja saponaria]|uniref:Heat-inducible transcription repressor n=1 Tax=Quillaja saponaria TaxID=32244 RepID=A0AAD7L8T2_QUISA|nr:Heat-inducible transcription repressor [Quillaja saponaria]KAJ7953752.1 Heat-inducible transcription repressor [Quillaja saponaria]